MNFTNWQLKTILLGFGLRKCDIMFTHCLHYHAFVLLLCVQEELDRNANKLWNHVKIPHWNIALFVAHFSTLKWIAVFWRGMLYFCFFFFLLLINSHVLINHNYCYRRQGRGHNIWASCPHSDPPVWSLHRCLLWGEMVFKSFVSSNSFI